jgi:hypothetical protein
MGAEGFVLLVVWGKDGPGGAGCDRGRLVERGWWGKAVKAEGREVEC